MNILNFDQEIIALIFSHLPIKDICDVQLTCKDFNFIINSSFFKQVYKWSDMLDDLKLDNLKEKYIFLYNPHCYGKYTDWNFLCSYYLYPNEEWSSIGLVAGGHIKEYNQLHKSSNHDYRPDTEVSVWSDNLELYKYLTNKFSEYMWDLQFMQYAIMYHAHSIFDHIMNSGCIIDVRFHLFLSDAIASNNLHAFRKLVSYDTTIHPKNYVNAFKSSIPEIREYIINNYRGSMSKVLESAINDIDRSDEVIEYIMDNYADEIDMYEVTLYPWTMYKICHLKKYGKIHRNIDRQYTMINGLFKADNHYNTSWDRMNIFRNPWHHFKLIVNLGYFYVKEFIEKLKNIL